MLLNVLWSILCIAPISVYCYQSMKRPWMYGFVAGSLVAYVVPATALRKLYLSSSTRVYRLLRVPLLVRLTQDRS